MDTIKGQLAIGLWDEKSKAFQRDFVHIFRILKEMRKRINMCTGMLTKRNASPIRTIFNIIHTGVKFYSRLCWPMWNLFFQRVCHIDHFTSTN